MGFRCPLQRELRIFLGPCIDVLRIERDVGSSRGGNDTAALFARLDPLLKLLPAVIEPRTRHGHNRTRIIGRVERQRRKDLGSEAETLSADHEHGFLLGRI